MLNYFNLSEEDKKTYDAFADEVYKFRGASVFDGDEPYVELKRCAYKHKDTIRSIIKKYGYKVVNEIESEGSDYTAYYIWFEKEG